MTYNSQREPLALREYGRTVQEMVNYCVEIENREQRQACAEAIISIMARMNADSAQQPDFQHKLWDQLAIMSNYQLDVDYPYEVIRPEDIAQKPTPLKYPVHRIRYRHYGHLVEAMMRKLEQMPAGEERDELAGQLADAMKQNLFDFNRDAMDDGKVRADIKAYTDGEVALPDDFDFRAITSGRVLDKPSRKKKRK